MKRFGIIGDPVAHSMSPRLFTAAYHGRYPYDLIEGSDFSASWARFLREYDGINVTAPFKEAAFRAVDHLSDEARRIGAVNLVVKTPEGTLGYNSDYDGVLRAIREAIPEPGGNALVIGCGGAGKAAAAAAADLGYTVLITNRTPERAEATAARLGLTAIPISCLRDQIRISNLVLYTIPGPIEGLSAADFSEGIYLLEANYRDPVFATGGPFRYIGGRRWLLHQAIAGYHRFTGEVPDAEAIESVI